MTNEPNQTEADDADEMRDEATDAADPEPTTEGSPTAVTAAASGGQPEDDQEADPSVEDTIDESSDEEPQADTPPEEPTEAEADQQEVDETDEPADADEAETDEAQQTADQEQDEADQEDEADQDEADEPELTVPEFTDLSEQGAEWLDGLFERMYLEAGAEVTERDDRPHVDISGKEADRLLGAGKLGPKAIEGIETLMQSVFSEDDDASDLYVDVGDQRTERKEMLERVASEMADRAVELHKSLTISGLNSTERRIIHRRLRDYDDVETESVGDGIFRRLKIEPTG